ncbi:MAG: OmpA family protein, partial [Saprospiraceae bacterium]
FAPFDPNGNPATPQDFSLNLNSTKNEGPVTFSRDFKTIYYTQNNNRNGVSKAGKDGQVHLKIYWAKAGKRDWEPQGEMPFCSDDYSCLTPSMSIDGKRMYFASDMAGGFGSYDIYYVEKSEFGNWGSPVNLGAGINTDKNDMSPCVTQAGTLFFASAGHNSLGGRDLFYANAAGDGFGDVVNLNSPFNTEADEASIIVDFDGKRGFFVSERERGYGKADIYSFTINKGIEGVEKPKVIPAEIVVINAKTGEPLQGAAIHILQPSEDGFRSGQDNYYTLDLLPVQDQKNALSLQLVRKGADDMGNPDLLTNLNGQASTDFARYRNYFLLVSLDGFQTAERLIAADSKESGQLKFLLKEAPVCLRASGIISTDKFGTRVANATLKFVHKSTGYVETVRTNLNGQYDACLSLEGQYIAYVERERFKPENFQFTAQRDKPDFEEVRLRPLDTEVAATVEDVMPLSNGLRAGSVLVMDKIFYEYNKATLNYGAVQRLDALFDLMKRYPEMEIELVVHTDTRGDAKLNQELTDKRAENAKTYLVYRGVAENRIKAYGRGETEPRNKCTEGVECSDEQHAENNRIEVKIQKLGMALLNPKP